MYGGTAAEFLLALVKEEAYSKRILNVLKNISVLVWKKQEKKTINAFYRSYPFRIKDETNIMSHLQEKKH